MRRVCILILQTDGTNCDVETAEAFRMAGGEPETVHINALRAGSRRLADYQIFVIPGGFSYGDHIAAGTVLAVELLTVLREELGQFVEHGRLVLGICNGFQVLVRTGLLSSGRLGNMEASLETNDCGYFVCRWVPLVIERSRSVFAGGMEGETGELMIAHGEGKFFARDETLPRLEREGQVVFRYADAGANPNGSLQEIAGICDPTGRILGMMPHPERFVRSTQHPNWRRMKRIKPWGLRLFENAVAYAARG
ncbi:MAG: phosphoribosylformylglycinamidine synthase I [bacterium]|nr:phosphoribosylformylglycinamidine synthase I [bacterium]MDZ4295746.1 phosphoribosylformylglycinamidine synthase I [Patescibacteria group bacterium]